MKLHDRHQVEGTSPPVYIGHRPYKSKDGQRKTSNTYFYEYNHEGRKHSGPLKTSNKQAAIKAVWALLQRIERGEANQVRRKVEWEEFTERYIDLKRDKNRAPKTIEKYELVLGQLVAFARDAGRRYPSNFTAKDYWAFNGKMTKDGLESKTRADRLTIIKQVFKWGHRTEKLLGLNPRCRVSSLRLIGALLLATSLGAAPPSAGLDGPAGATASRDRGQVLAELAANPLPPVDVPAMADADYAKRFAARRDAVRQKRAALAIELYKTAPAAPELPELMAERWETLSQAGNADAALSEMDEYLRGVHAAAERLSASYQRARIRIQYGAKDTAARLAAIDEFKTAVGEADARPMVPQLLYTAGRFASDSAEKERLMAQVVAEYPDSAAAKVVRGAGRKRAAVGATMELTFKDSITGKRVDLADFRGQVVVVDFWAAWCTDCAAEMPDMKRIYGDVKGKGVQFIGVSLDVPEEEGGLQALRTSVARFGIDWPQYYPGGKWDSEFSSTWGVFAVPTVFVLDRKGVIVSTDARGKLETILPKLLERSEP